jgi:hypothetical protein
VQTLSTPSLRVVLNVRGDLRGKQPGGSVDAVAVTAFGREKLLAAKEDGEAHGDELLHTLTDSVWSRKPGLTIRNCGRLATRLPAQRRW